MRKLSADERPLHLRLCAGPSETLLCLVLKENDTGDVNVGFRVTVRYHKSFEHEIHYTRLFCEMVEAGLLFAVGCL